MAILTLDSEAKALQNAKRDSINQNVTGKKSQCPNATREQGMS